MPVLGLDDVPWYGGCLISWSYTTLKQVYLDKYAVRLQTLYRVLAPETASRMSELDGTAAAGEETPRMHLPVGEERFARLEDQFSQLVTMLGASMKKKEPGDVVADDASRGGGATAPERQTRDPATAERERGIFQRVGEWTWTTPFSDGYC